jgi:hypothetical protein
MWVTADEEALMTRHELNNETDRLCGFGMEPAGIKVWRIDNSTGNKRELTCPEGNLWASVHQTLK